MHAPRTKRRIIGIICLLTGLALITAGCGNESNQSDAEKPTPSDSLAIVLVGADSVSVLELLLRDHVVDYQASAMGAFVKA
ncbi:MAG: hypothetical protein KKA42_09135, partial [candidate division Zixibacteria bacterium]|nr:hypothetical protein [candidate division Zixibacteria bacterium]